jgi:hypothetical protein
VVGVGAQARVRTKPKPLAKDAGVSDWTSFLGPSHNGTSSETRLTRTLPPPLVWEFPKGTSYTSPAILGDRLVFVHRVGDEEIVECLHAETGASRWQFRYPTSFEDRYGYNNGPRSSPVIDGSRVYTLGAQGQLHCFDIGAGTLVWRRHINAEYKVPQDFFGTAATPLVEDRLLVINVGAPGGPCVVGLTRCRDAKCGGPARNGAPAMPRRYRRSSTDGAASSCSREANQILRREACCPSIRPTAPSTSPSRGAADRTSR